MNASAAEIKESTSDYLIALGVLVTPVRITKKTSVGARLIRFGSVKQKDENTREGVTASSVRRIGCLEI
jgi:hypothetical protein